MSDFEAHNPPKLFSNMSSSSLSSLAQRIPPATSNKNESSTSSFSYQGISLPKALAEFLAVTEITLEKRDERKGLRKRGSHSFSEMEQVKELGRSQIKF